MLRRKVDPWELGWHLPFSSKQESNPNEGAAEIPQLDKGPEPQLSSSKKEETFPMGQFRRRNRDPAGATLPPVTWRQRCETGRRMASGWQIDWIPGLLSIKMGWQHICLSTDSQTRPPPTPIRGERDLSKLEPNTADFKVDHHLRRWYTAQREAHSPDCSLRNFRVTSPKHDTLQFCMEWTVCDSSVAVCIEVGCWCVEQHHDLL